MQQFRQEKIDKFQELLNNYINGNNGEIKKQLKGFSKNNICEMMLYYMENTQTDLRDLRIFILTIQNKL